MNAQGRLREAASIHPLHIIRRGWRRRGWLLLGVTLIACGSTRVDPSDHDASAGSGGTAGLGANGGRNSAGVANGGLGGHTVESAAGEAGSEADGGTSGERDHGDAGAAGASASEGGSGGIGTTGGNGGATTGGGAPGGGGGSGGAHAGGGSAGAQAGQGGSGGVHVASAGSAGAPGGSGGSGSAQAGNGGSGGVGGGAPKRDHCIDGYAPDPSDATIGDGPVEFKVSNQIDLTVQPEVMAWFQARRWENANFQWHNIKRCHNGTATDDVLGGGINPCLSHPELIPANYEGKGAGDGLEFLAFHRYLIQSVKQLWPVHREQFEGWEHFPTKASDVPPQWQADWTAWMSNIAANGAKADDPASHLNEIGFESEGAFGQWIQTTSGLNGALHFKWVRPLNSEHGLGNQFTYIDNYMFWKMQGWIDKVWTRYRAAKGLQPDDASTQAAVIAQCRQFEALMVMLDPNLANQ